MVKVLVERFRVLVDDSKATFKETILREWKVVVQEILRFLKVDTAYKNTRPLRYCTILDSYHASLPYVARFHAKKVLKLRDTLLVSYHRNETTETSNNGGLNDQSGTSGLIDINLAMDMTDPTLPPNPRKAILHQPSATHLISQIDCVHSPAVMELMRGVRSQLAELISGLGGQDLAPISLGFSHSLSRYKLKFNP